MLHIETDTVVFTGGVVYKVIQGGDFDNESLVEVYRDGNEDKTSIGAFQPYYLKGFWVKTTQINNKDAINPAIYNIRRCVSTMD